MLILVLLMMLGLSCGFLLLGKIYTLPQESIEYNTLVTVIISTDLPSKQLRKCLAALYRQEYRNIEIILAVTNPDAWDEQQRSSYFNTKIVYADPTNHQELLYRCARIASGELFLFMQASILVQENALNRLITLFYRKYAIISISVAQGKLTLKQLLNMMQVNTFRNLSNSRKKQGLFESVYLVSAKVYFANKIHREKYHHFGLETGFYLSKKAARIYNIYSNDAFINQDGIQNNFSLKKAFCLSFLNAFMILLWGVSCQLIYVFILICLFNPIWIFPTFLIYLLQSMQFVYFSYSLSFEHIKRSFFFPFYFLDFFYHNKTNNKQLLNQNIEIR